MALPWDRKCPWEEEEEEMEQGEEEEEAAFRWGEGIPDALLLILLAKSCHLTRVLILSTSLSAAPSLAQSKFTCCLSEFRAGTFP